MPLEHRARYLAGLGCSQGRPRSIAVSRCPTDGCSRAGFGQGRGELPRPRSPAIAAPAPPGRRFRGREGKFLCVNTVLDWGPFDSGPLPPRALCPLPPLPNRLKPELAQAAAGARGSGLRSLRAGTRGSPSRPEGNAPGLGPARFWRSPWTLANGPPGFQLADFLESLMVVSCGPLGCLAIARRTEGGEWNVSATGCRRRGLTFPVNWDRSKPLFLPQPSSPAALP
nr:uncharacterized protein LOC123284924 [Equus asinus]